MSDKETRLEIEGNLATFYNLTPKVIGAAPQEVILNQELLEQQFAALQKPKTYKLIIQLRAK